MACLFLRALTWSPPTRAESSPSNIRFDVELKAEPRAGHVTVRALPGPGCNECKRGFHIEMQMSEGRTERLDTLDKPGVWETIYKGKQHSTFLSGLPDGMYRFRVRIDGTPADHAVIRRLEIAHHPLSRAVTLLVIGGIVFLSLAAAIAYWSVRPSEPLEQASPQEATS